MRPIFLNYSWFLVKQILCLYLKVRCSWDGQRYETYVFLFVLNFGKMWGSSSYEFVLIEKKCVCVHECSMCWDMWSYIKNTLILFNTNTYTDTETQTDKSLVPHPFTHTRTYSTHVHTLILTLTHTQIHKYTHTHIYKYTKQQQKNHSENIHIVRS